MRIITNIVILAIYLNERLLTVQANMLFETG